MIITPPITSMQDAFNVKDKNVIVTGGNRGIGLGIATAFAQSGANVAILCRNVAKGKEVAADLTKQYGGKHECFACDVSDLNGVRTAVAQVLSAFGRIDVLVNNAGVASMVPFLEDKDLAEWHRVINIDLHGTANMIHCVAPHMREAGVGGTIINISSVAGQVIGSDALEHPNAPYYAAKAAVNHFSRYMAVELGASGIRVNVIAPGPFHTDLDDDLPPSLKEHIMQDCPMHRFGETIEVGAYCVFLASPAGCHVSGAICVHDGGMICAGL